EITWLASYRNGARPATQRIRVVIADDHTLLRQGIRAMLEVIGDFEVVGEAADGREAVRLAEQIEPDVVLMDVGMPLLNGLEATRQIRQRAARVRVLALITEKQTDHLYDVLAAGAAGCIVKDADAGELVRALTEVSRGNAYLAPTLSQTVVWDYLHLAKTGQRRQNTDPLSAREREVLQLIAEGYSNQEIAGMLFLSVKTVEAHKAHIMDKLGLKGRAGLLKYALKKGMISLDD
ncbi:MAG: response regulator transcription factor, partial [Dehalococcoidia bacterium]|nr:response regulator transcription factor [Dehalococcoidia bacterium]